MAALLAVTSLEAAVDDKKDQGMLIFGVEGALGFVLLVLLWVGSCCVKKERVRPVK